MQVICFRRCISWKAMPECSNSLNTCSFWKTGLQVFFATLLCALLQFWREDHCQEWWM